MRGGGVSTFEWQPLHDHLKAALALLAAAPDDAYYIHAYVDVSTDFEALEQIVDDVEFNIRKAAEPK